MLLNSGTGGAVVNLDDPSGLVTTLVLGNLLQLTLLLGTGVQYVRGRGTQQAYQGRWQFRIDWHPHWAQGHLFNRPVKQPHSHGDVRLFMTHPLSGSKYRGGFGEFDLRDGEDKYAELVVEVQNLVLGRRKGLIRNMRQGENLEEFQLRSLARRKVRDFSYGSWIDYFVVIGKSSGDLMQGQLVVRRPKEPDEVVADFRATRS